MPACSVIFPLSSAAAAAAGAMQWAARLWRWKLAYDVSLLFQTRENADFTATCRHYK